MQEVQRAQGAGRADEHRHPDAHADSVRGQNADHDLQPNQARRRGHDQVAAASLRSSAAAWGKSAWRSSDGAMVDMGHAPLRYRLVRE